MTADPRIAVWRADEIADLDAAARRLSIRALLKPEVAPEALPVVVGAVADEIDGYGGLTPLLRDPSITDVLVNGDLDVWVERDGRLERTEVRFPDVESVMVFVERHVSNAEGRVDSSRPIGDVRLPDGSRLHVVLPPLAPRGPLISIRRFPEDPLTLDDLVAQRTLSAAEACTLVEHVRCRRSIAIGGATGTGKTTLLNALLAHVPHDERIVTIEETPELSPRHPHCVSLVARAPSLEGTGAVSIEELVRASLRMRPDRIVVGEVRGREVVGALTAMSTGHAGSLVTVHARSAPGVRSRLTQLALGGAAQTEAQAEAVVAAAIEVVVFLARESGTRRVAEIQGP